MALGISTGAAGNRHVRVESRHLESRAKASARLDLEGSAEWVIQSSRGLWGGDALFLSTGAAGTDLRKIHCDFGPVVGDGRFYGACYMKI
jgi:hypothetical protein